MPAATLTALRGFNLTLGAAVPGLSARVAERLFTSPRRHRPPFREHQAERAGIREELRPGLSLIRWGVDARRPRLLAMHGWEGRATQWGRLAAVATVEGFEVLALDAPGHGHSSGRRATVRDFVEAMLLADARYGPFAAVLGHSFGGPSLALALDRGLRAERAVLIASPARASKVLRGFAGMLGLSAPAEDAFFSRMEQQTGIPPVDLDITKLAKKFPQPALILHSRDDREVAFTESEAIAAAWPNASLHPVEALGHRRILRDPKVIKSSLNFLTSTKSSSQSSEKTPFRGSSTQV